MTAAPFLPPISTTIDGLTLRSWQPGDGATLAEVSNASYDHLRPWMEWASADDTPDAAESRIRKFAGAYLCNEDFILSVWEDGELVGGSGFHLRVGPLSDRNAEIGMWVRGDRADQGLGTRILRAMVTWGFEDWGWKRLVWKNEVANKASARVAEKAGFVLEATLRGDRLTVDGERSDTQVWALLPSDIEASTGS